MVSQITREQVLVDVHVVAVEFAFDVVMTAVGETHRTRTVSNQVVERLLYSRL